MSGIYVHIPYCTQKCIYCDFYSVPTRKSKRNYLFALVKEMQNRKHYLADSVKTLYLGGGTPSNLDLEEMQFIVENLRNNFDLSQCEEMTLEANPEHLNAEYISFLRKLGFNRISIGIQSFDDADLRTLCRKHNSEQAISAIRTAREQGFENISLDLIFNLPSQTLEKWKKNLDTALSLSPEHLSCYCLTIEKNTILHKMIQKGLIDMPDEETGLQQFDFTMQQLASAGYEHYEVSNYCKPAYRSKHNTAYWQGVEYLGLGASAHSFDIRSRSWNPADINAYIYNIEHGIAPETELLSPKDCYNEYIMLSLRTAEGVSPEYIKRHFPQFFVHYESQSKKVSSLMPQKWQLVNSIALELMI